MENITNEDIIVVNKVIKVLNKLADIQKADSEKDKNFERAYLDTLDKIKLLENLKVLLEGYIPPSLSSTKLSSILKRIQNKVSSKETRLSGLLKRIKNSRYLSDKDIRKQYNNFKITDLNIDTYTYDDETLYSGYINVEFPNTEHEDFEEEVVDHFIVYDTDLEKIAFDKWYPENVYNELTDYIRKAIKRQYPDNFKESEFELIQRLDDTKVKAKNKNTGKYQIVDIDDNLLVNEEFDTEEELDNYFKSL